MTDLRAAIAELRGPFEEKLATLRINARAITFREKAAGFYSIDIGFSNLEERSIKIELMGETIPQPAPLRRTRRQRGASLRRDEVLVLQFLQERL